MGELIKYLTTEAAAIKSAPVTFLVGALVIAVSAYLVASWYFSGQIETLRSRLQLRDDEIARFKNELNAASPEDAKKRMATLEKKLADLTPRHLSDQQRISLVSSLRQSTGQIAIMEDGGTLDAQAFADDFHKAFQSAGWKTTRGSSLGMRDPPRSGLGVWVTNTSSLSEREKAVFAALDAAGLTADVLQSPQGFAGPVLVVSRRQQQ